MVHLCGAISGIGTDSPFRSEACHCESLPVPALPEADLGELVRGLSERVEAYRRERVRQAFIEYQARPETE